MPPAGGQSSGKCQRQRDQNVAEDREITEVTDRLRDRLKIPFADIPHQKGSPADQSGSEAIHPHEAPTIHKQIGFEPAESKRLLPIGRSLWNVYR